MKRRPRHPLISGRLRQRAEALLRRAPGVPAPASAETTSQLVYELQVHQAELEMQNDELHRVQLEIEASRDRFAELFEFAPVGYLAVDAGGIILDANLTAAELMGATRHDLAGRKLTRYITAPSQDAYYLYAQRVMAGQGKQACELILRRADGTTWAAELRSAVIAAPRAGRRQSLITLSDITVRKHGEETRSTLAAIVETSQDAILSQNAGGLITSWNGAAARLYDYTEAEIIGQSVMKLVPPDRREEQAQIQRRILLGERIEQFETIRQRKDGRLTAVSLAISPIRDLAGHVTGASAIARDITQQKELEKTRREREQAQAFVDFFAESSVGLLFADAKGRVERVNPAQLEMIGRTAVQVMGQPVARWFEDPAQGTGLLRQLAGGRTVKNYHARLRHANGSTIHGLIDANGLWRNDQLLYSRWLVQDITDRVKVEQDLLAAVENEQLRFGQDLHDDLCQQLTGIEYLCRSLVGQPKLDARMERKISKIAGLVRDSNHHARELARGLSPVTTADEGLMNSLSQLAERTRIIFRRDCRFHCNPPVQLPNPGAGAQLYRIAQEAVSNSLRHGKASRIEIRLARRGPAIVLSIKDNGIGLPRNPGKQQGMGLRIMTYRAGVIAASLVVQRRRARGTEVICTLPQPGHQPSETTP